MSKKLSQRKFEEHMSQLSPEELVGELAKLYKKFKDVQHFYQMEFGGKAGRVVVLDDYKKAVRGQFYSAASGSKKKPKAAQLRRILSDFKHLAVFQTDMVDLILYRVECAVDYTNDFGGVDLVFYESASNAFAQAVKIIQEEKLEELFMERCQNILMNTAGIGWDFQGMLATIYRDSFGAITLAKTRRSANRRLTTE